VSNRGPVSPPSSPSPAASRSSSQPNTRTPPPAPPLIAPTGSPTLDCMADAINSAVSPFQNAPPAEQGAAGWVAQGLGGVLGLVGAPAQLIDNAFAGLTAPIAALFPSMPAITLLGMHIGMLHTHTHPPSLIPPAPPIPLPSIGMLVGAGSMAVLGCGLPLARAGDVGISLTCGTLAPPFEVFTGSSNVFVGGARAARILDITKHCDPTTMGPFGIAMGIAGVAAGAAGAVATGQAAQAAQAAADAAVLALKLLAGKDPGLPPGIGALVGPPCPTVMIGGFPCPPIGDMVIGSLMKGLKRLVAAAKKLRASRRSNANCGDGSHPIYLVTGENYDQFTDFVSPGLLRWKRYYSTALAACDGPLGFGFRHSYQRHLDVRLHQIIFIDWDGVELEFPGFPPGTQELREHGHVLRKLGADRYELATRGEPTLVFEGDRFGEILPLVAVRGEAGLLELDYDARGWLVGFVDRAQDDSEARHYRLSHDARGRISGLSELGAEGGARFAYSYTAAGELDNVRDAGDGLWAHDYDPAHRWVRQTDPRGYSYHFTYDAQGRCISARGDDGMWAAEVEYLPEKGLTLYREIDREIDDEGARATWAYHYDPEGFITKIVNPAGGARIRERDGEGKIVRDIDPGGRDLLYVYDKDGANLGRLDRFAHFHQPETKGVQLADPRARKWPETALARLFDGLISAPANAVSGATGAHLMLPPELRRLALDVFRLRPAGAPPQTPVPRVWRDALGLPCVEVDARQRRRRIFYDAARNRVARQDRDGRIQRWTTTRWNLEGARLSPLDHETRYTYSNVEQLVELVDPLHNSTRYVYDRSHRLIQIWRCDRLRDQYEWDEQDRLLTRRDGEGARIFENLEFHANQLVSLRRLASGDEHRFDYDARGRITGASTRDHEVQRRFGPGSLRLADLRDGRGLERWVRPEREVVLVLGRFEWSLEHPRPGEATLCSPTGTRTHLSFGDDGVVARECGNGTREWLQYDEEGRLEARLAARPEPGGGWTSWGVRHRYTGEGDLTSTADSVRGTSFYEVDVAHRLVAERGPGGERVTYTHDAADNLVAKPGLSRLEIGQGNLAVGTAEEIFEHDARLRMSSRRSRGGGGQRYFYDSVDMLVRIEIDRPEGGPSEIWTAGYDAEARRLWTEFEGRRREFYWDGDRLAAEIGHDGELRVYLYAGHDAMVPLAFIDYENVDADPAQGQEYQVFSDPTGVPLHIEDARCEIVWWASKVEPWGRVDIHDSARIEYNLRWAGHYRDPETGLHQNRFRYYDPELGRYLSPDPIGYQGSEVNLYAYCPNPLVQVDVLGLAHSNRSNDPGDQPEGPPRRPADMSDAELSTHMDGLAQDAWSRMQQAHTNGDRTVTLADGTVLRVTDSGRGPCLSVVMDTQTGGVFYGQNTGKSATNLAEPLATNTSRVIADHQANHPSPYQPGWTRSMGYPGSHSEVQAASQALNTRPGSQLSELAIYNVRTENIDTNPAPPMVRCGNCNQITDGARALTD